MLNALLWNVPLTAGLAIVLTALCRLPSMHKRPALRHLLWLLLLAKLITPPLIGVPLLPAVARSDDAAAIATPPSVPAGYRESALDRRTPAYSAVDDTTSAFVDEGAGRDAGGVTSRELRGGTQVPYLGGLFAVSLIGTCVLLTVHGGHAVKLCRWLKRAGTEDSLLAESCALVASSLEIRGVVRSCVVDARTVPLLWAWHRPLVVVPRQLIDDLSPQQLRSIVAHELAHYLRRDHWTNVFAFTVKVLLWWNPVVWWADRELRAAQELCCDAIAIDRCGANRRSYATTLLKALDFIQAEPLASRELAPGMGSRASILRRFEMIGETKLSYRLSRWTLLVLMVLGIPLICIPVRGQEKTAPAPAITAPADADLAKTAADGDGKKVGTAEAEPAQTGRAKVKPGYGQLQLNFGAIGLQIVQYKERMGRYPEDLKKLKKPLPKDIFSPTGEDYRYEAQRSRFILSSCGKDRVYGNDDDQIFVGFRGGATSGERHEVYPLKEEAKPQNEQLVGVRPRGNCSISGKVVLAETGKPVEGARMYLHYGLTHGSIFINTAGDGTFVFKDIPVGPFSLQSSMTAGYQDASYDPEGKSGQFPQFSLGDGEQRSGIVVEIEPARRISGKILDENGKIPENIATLTVLAWRKRDGGKGYENKQARVKPGDGSYLIDGLGDKPVYLMAINWRAAQEGSVYPPIYYPSTFSRSEAKQITFDEKPTVDGVDIALQKEGGLVLEGTVIDEAGKPVPEVFVVVHRRDMLFDLVTAYTDERGNYQIQGLGDGEFLVHLDAVHRGLVRIRTPMDLDGETKKTRRDFTLTPGVEISGKFVDEQGNDWQIGQSYGHAYGMGGQQGSGSSFSLTGFRNKHRPKNVSRMGMGGSFATGEGGYESAQMIFPTKSTFVIQGVMPGNTKLNFSPKKEGQEVVEILHDGQNILESGIESKPGQEIKDVKIVIGTR